MHHNLEKNWCTLGMGKKVLYNFGPWTRRSWRPSMGTTLRAMSNIFILFWSRSEHFCSSLNFGSCRIMAKHFSCWELPWGTSRQNLDKSSEQASCKMGSVWMSALVNSINVATAFSHSGPSPARSSWRSWNNVLRHSEIVKKLANDKSKQAAIVI